MNGSRYMNGVAMTGAFLGLFTGCDLAHGAEDQPKAEPKADSLSAVLKDIPAGTQTSYFEVRAGDETIGYTTVSLNVPASSGDVVYEYRRNAAARMGEGVRVEGLVIARLRPDFEPIRIDMKQTRISGDETVWASHRIDVGPSAVEHMRVQEGSAIIRPTRGPRPASPFFFGIEVFAQQIQLRPDREFTIAEFNPETGQTRNLVFSAVPGEGGGSKLVVRKDDGQPGYTFVFDDRGVMQEWGAAGSPIVERRTTPERVKELKTELEGTKKPAASP